jgi:hypothetical protein
LPREKLQNMKRTNPVTLIGRIGNSVNEIQNG